MFSLCLYANSRVPLLCTFSECAHTSTSVGVSVAPCALPPSLPRYTRADGCGRASEIPRTCGVLGLMLAGLNPHVVEAVSVASATTQSLSFTNSP